MASTYNQLMIDLCEWHRDNGAKAVPCEGMDYSPALVHQFRLAYSSEIINVPVDCTFKGYQEQLCIEACAAPLITGFLSGFNKQELGHIALSHGVDAGMFIMAFSNENKSFIKPDGSTISSAEVFRVCFDAIEANSHSSIFRMYNQAKDEDTAYPIAMTAASSPQLWPKTLLSNHGKPDSQKAEKVERAISAEIHNIINDVVHDDQLPFDATGPRYDWFLDRSGMLLPGVIRKSLGDFTLWEHLAVSAASRNNPTLSKLMGYCLDNPAESLRPHIYNGLMSMTVGTEVDATQGIDVLSFLKTEASDSWLSEINKSCILKLNMMDCSDQDDFKEDLKQRPRLFVELWMNQETLFERLLGEIIDTPINSIGAHHFKAINRFSAIEGVLEQQVYPTLNREAAISHLMRAMENLLEGASIEPTHKEDVRYVAQTACKATTRKLSNGHDLDYSAISGICSASVKVLVEAGLDIRRLPKMNTRDKGRLLEDDLGL